MCGIFAFLGNYNFELLNKCLEKIKMRGPDNSSLIKIDKDIVFGFHRLAINGLDSISNQPLYYKNLSLICNGEIYNYKNLIEKYNFKMTTNSDCEIILHMYSTFGIQKTLNELDGVFGFVLRDDEKIYVARDPIGIRPIFISQSKYGTLISSEAKCILNKNDNVYPLVPGSYEIYLKNTQMAKGIYYKLPSTLIINKPIEIIINEIRDLLINSVNKRLMSDRPIGALLSGGLDSSIISSIISKKVSNLTTFSIGLENSPDLIKAQEVANYIKSTHHNIKITINEMINSIENVIKITETYDITTIRASVPNYLISKYIAENTDIKVIFSGEGADELFGGYLYFHNAPTDKDFDEETRHLVNNLYKFDVLRADRTTASNGLEVRVPFLDKNFINYIMQLSSKYKNYKFFNIEKGILRKAFENYLPENIIWRQKDAFSDAVGYNWVTEIKNYADTIISDKELKNCNKLYSQDTPTCKEGLLYRKIFEKYYPNKTNLIGYIWRPKWSETQEPSATALRIHKK